METSFLSPYTKCLGLLVNEGSWLKKKKKKKLKTDFIAQLEIFAICKT